MQLLYIPSETLTMQLLCYKHITIAAHHRANYMDITGNAVCAVLLLLLRHSLVLILWSIL